MSFIFFYFFLFFIFLLNVLNNAENLNQFCQTPCKDLNVVCSSDECKMNYGKCNYPRKMFPLSKMQRSLVYKLHNTKRDFVASGRETAAENIGSNNINALTYAMELELMAQCWANTCTDDYDPCRSSPNFENITQNFFKFPIVQAEGCIDEAVKKWYDQIQYLNKTLVENYQSDSQTREVAVILSGSLKAFGCGIAKYGYQGVVICSYAPYAGEEAPIYQMSKSRCSKDRGECICNKAYTSLCGASVIQDDKDFEKPFTLGGKGLGVDEALMEMLVVIWFVL